MEIKYYSINMFNFIFFSITSYISQVFKKVFNYLNRTLYIIFFRYQTSDVFIDLINVPLILLANLYFKVIQIIKKNTFFFILFLLLSFLSRVDTLIYIFVFVNLLLFFAIKEKIKLHKDNFYFKKYPIFIIIFLLSFYL